MLKGIDKKIIISMLIVIGIAIALSRVTYATFTVHQEATQDVLVFDKIELTLCPDDLNGNPTCEIAGNIIGTYNSGGNKAFKAYYPVADPSTSNYPTGWDNIDKYVFTVENTGDLALTSTIFLEPDTTATNEYTSLSINNGSGADAMTQTFTGFVDSTQYKYFKVAIIEAGTEGALTANNVKTFDTIANDSFSYTNPSGTVYTHRLLSVELAPGESKTYYLYMWLSDNAMNSGSSVDANTGTVPNSSGGAGISGTVGSNKIMGKYLVTQISAIGEYMPATNSVKIVTTNGSSSASRVLPSNGTASITVAPNSGYYLRSASCTNGYTTNATTGASATAEQEVTISSNSNIGGSTCTFTYQAS